MAALNPNKLHVKYTDQTFPVSPVLGRRYTLTHSDSTGDLFLSIGVTYDRAALNSFQARLMRDEVLGEWQEKEEEMALHLMCHVSKRWLTFGSARWRYNIFQSHMRLVLEALRHGDRELYHMQIELDNSPVYVHFESHKSEFNKVETWGKMGDYALPVFE